MVFMSMKNDLFCRRLWFLFYFWWNRIVQKKFVSRNIGLTIFPRETGNNAYGKFWRDEQRVL